ncbi:MAG: hypothetical protein CME06_07630 [Gemmatimonadetes bacterium]|nr:hypothetical protein [Gemmatimonadota bacterium]
MMRKATGGGRVTGAATLLLALGALASAEEAAPVDQAVEAVETLRSASRERVDRIEQLEQSFHSRHERAIARLDRVVRAYPEDPKAAALGFQLAELLFAHERAEHLVRFENLDAFEGEAPIADYSRSKAAYRALLEAHPDAPEAAGALYGLAYCLREEGANDKALERYAELVDRFSDSTYAPEAHLRMGEEYFDANRLEHAAESYRSVLASPDSPLYEEALYKLGWTYYRLSRYADAISVFTYLVDDTEAGEALGGMASEAKSYIAISFSEFSGVEGLQSYLQRIGDRSYGAELLLSLGGLFRGEGEFQTAERAFRGFVENYPEHKEAPRAQRELVEVLELQEQEGEALAARARYSSLFGPGTTWADEWVADDQAVDVRRSAEEFHYSSAAGLHGRARDAADAEGLRRAVDLYASFLDRYPQSDRKLQVAMQRADAWLDLEQPGAAADHFVAAADIADLLPESSAIAANALYNAIHSLNAAGVEVGTSNFERMSTTIDRLAEQHAGDERIPSLWMRRAELHFDAELHAEAAEDFVRCAGNAFDSELAVRATEMVARSYFEVGRFAEAEEWAAKMDPAIESSSALRAAAIYRQAETLRDAGEASEAAAHFLRVVAIDPLAEGNDAALYDAATAWLGAGEAELAARDFERIPAEYPDSDLAKDALRQAAVLREEAGEHTRAAVLLGRLASRTSGTKIGDDAAYYSALYWHEAGEMERARSAFAAYHSEYETDHGRNLDSRIREIRLAESAGAGADELSGRLGALLDAAERFRSAGAEVPVAILAEAQWKRIDLDLPDYREYAIRPPLQETTQRKETKMNALLDGYSRASEYRSAKWSIRSLERMGEVLEEFHRAIIGAPTPSDLSQVEAALYLMELEDYASPYGEQAIESYVAAVEMSVENGLDEPFAELARARAETFRPGIDLPLPQREGPLGAPIQLAVSAELALPELSARETEGAPAGFDPPRPGFAIGSGTRTTLWGTGLAGGIATAIMAAQGSNTGSVVALGALSTGALGIAIWAPGRDDGQEDAKSNKNYSSGDPEVDLDLKGPRVELKPDLSRGGAKMLLTVPLN